MTDLTPPQREALTILSEATEPVDGWKQSNARVPIRRVNIKAVGALVKLRLAKAHYTNPEFWSPYTHDERYTITDAGRAALREILEQ